VRSARSTSSSVRAMPALSSKSALGLRVKAHPMMTVLGPLALMEGRRS